MGWNNKENTNKKFTMLITAHIKNNLTIREDIGKMIIDSKDIHTCSISKTSEFDLSW
jgi:hypothetical protein